jgi:hypothetical protein
MEFSDYIISLLTQLVGAAPALLLWIAVIVFGTVMLRRGGGRAERFLILGAAVGVVAALSKVTVTWSLIWLTRGGTGPTNTISNVKMLGIGMSIVSAAGIVLLIYAFWLKFKEWKTTVTTIELERGPHDAVPE